MTGLQFAQLVREYTRTNSVSFTDASIILLANVIKDDFAKEIAKADEDYFGVPSTRDLVASSNSDPTAREYTLPEDYLKIKKVEACLDGTNWLQLKEFDLIQYQRTTNEAEILNQFSNDEGKAFYDIFRKSLWIYSGAITANSGGLKLWYIAYPADIAVADLSGTQDLSVDPTTVTAGMPRQFHELWARKISITWKSSRPKPIPLTESELVFTPDFKSALSSIRNPNLDRSQIGSIPYNDGQQY